MSISGACGCQRKNTRVQVFYLSCRSQKLNEIFHNIFFSKFTADCRQRVNLRTVFTLWIGNAARPHYNTCAHYSAWDDTSTAFKSVRMECQGVALFYIFPIVRTYLVQFQRIFLYSSDLNIQNTFVRRTGCIKILFFSFVAENCKFVLIKVLAQFYSCYISRQKWMHPKGQN